MANCSGQEEKICDRRHQLIGCSIRRFDFDEHLGDIRRRGVNFVCAAEDAIRFTIIVRVLQKDDLSYGRDRGGGEWLCEWCLWGSAVKIESQDKQRVAPAPKDNAIGTVNFCVIVGFCSQYSDALCFCNTLQVYFEKYSSENEAIFRIRIFNGFRAVFCNSRLRADVRPILGLQDLLSGWKSAGSEQRD